MPCWVHICIPPYMYICELTYACMSPYLYICIMYVERHYSHQSKPRNMICNALRMQFQLQEKTDETLSEALGSMLQSRAAFRIVAMLPPLTY